MRYVIVFIALSTLFGIVECQCNDTSRPLILPATDSPQYFTSPEYPSYPPNSDCAWLVEASGDYDNLIINLQHFTAQQGDILSIHEGPDTTTGEFVVQLNGTSETNFNMYVSSGNQLYFTFHSDCCNEDQGFNILYVSNNTASQHPCGATINVTSDEQVLMSPNLPGPYSGADTCSWTFASISRGIVFRIKFLDMNSCNPENLTFYAGSSTSDTQLAVHCSTAYTYNFIDIETSAVDPLVVWTASNESDPYYGFMLTYQLVQCQCDDATSPWVLSSTDSPQYFTSPRYSQYQPQNCDCAWLIEAPGEYDDIIINIERFKSQQGDFLAIYEGPNTTVGELVVKIDGTNDTLFNLYVSSSNQLFFTFQSNTSNAQSGFRILYFSNNTANQHPCGETINATSEKQVLLSPNLPGPYSEADSCSWLFASEDRGVVFRIIFLDMNNCNPDYLTIYNGNSMSDTQLAQECSTAYTYNFTDTQPSASESLVVWTASNQTDPYYGFMLTYQLDVLGILLASPSANATVALTLREDQAVGNLNESVDAILLTYTGTLNLQILPSYEVTTNQTIALQSDVQVFGLTQTAPYLYLSLVSALDYEVINKFSLVVTMDDSDVPEVTYSVTFNVSVTDVDDVAPTFLNLPGNHTLERGEITGYYIYTVTAIDNDASAEYRIVKYEIFGGNTDSMFAIDSTSGNLTLKKDAKQVPASTLQYVLTIAAHSGMSALGSFSTFTVHVTPDSPPGCTRNTVWADTLDANIVGYGTNIQYIDTWSCSDDNINITYSIESVSPNLTTSLFTIDARTGGISLLRSFNTTEVVNRQFLLDIGATDSVTQMETFQLFVNVTGLSCLPNPRKLYVRMDQEVGRPVLNDLNCTCKEDLRYTLQQYPEGTFEVSSDVNGKALLILKASVVKVKFYSLSITATDGLDVADIEFKVIIQTKRCGIASATSLYWNLWLILLQLSVCSTNLLR